jgi:hypothetical protein
LRLGLLPGSYSKAEILSLVTKEPDEIAQFLNTAYDKNTLGPLIDYLDNLYGGLIDINHLRFWKGVANFLRKPDCQWMASFQPMENIIQNFAWILLKAILHDASFRPIATNVFTNLRRDDEEVLAAAWLRIHIYMHGL